MPRKSAKVVAFQATKPISLDEDLLVEIVEITPETAAKWLQQNTLNRQLRRSHVQFLSNEMQSGRWRLNGESVKISIDEKVLDGQHRLHAVVESGVAIKTLVIYGLDRDAFDTIDTGIVRLPKDILKLHFPEAPTTLCSTVGGSCGWVHKIEHGFTSKRAYTKLSNTQVLDIANTKPELWRCAQVIHSYPKDQRLITPTAGTALFYLTMKKDWELAEQYIRDLYTGEDLKQGSIAHTARGILIADRAKLVKMKVQTRLYIAVKGWNLLRRGQKSAVRRTLMPKLDEEAPEIL